MELTQRLESQTFLESSEKVHPDQIGFIGICGNKYPIKMGPNKIGRDPETCHVVINLNSISRQHAVLNVLSKHNFMLMDLDSANKTKLQDKILERYIPQPLKNGDTIQFGDVFGIFRLLEEETDLPMTQNLEIPETPIAKKHIGKVNHTAIVPESPEVSDRDDSFIVLSQTKKKIKKNSNEKFVKPSGNRIPIQSIGKKKINNVYWNSSKKSDSFHFDYGLKNVVISSVKSYHIDDQNINELGTNNSNKDNNAANTQKPDENSSVKKKTSAINDHKDIHDLDTQNISIFQANTPHDLYTANTQVEDNLPNVYKIDTSVDVCGENKDISIFDAETQVFVDPKQNNFFLNNERKSHDTSDDIILFDEIDGQFLDDNFESQAILPSSPILNTKDNLNNSSAINDEINYPNNFKRNIDTDCDDFDILPTQVLAIKSGSNENNIKDLDILPTQKNTKTENNYEDNKNDANIPSFSKKTPTDEDITDFEDNLEENDEKTEHKNIKFDELPTQIISLSEDNLDNDPTNFEDMLTQVLPEPEKESKLKSKVLKQINTINNNFKVPKASPQIVRKKDAPNTITKYLTRISPSKNTTVVSEDDDQNYYAVTQDILDDLYSQTGQEKGDTEKDANESTGSDCEIKISNMVATLSNEKVRDIIGVEKVSKLRRFPSDCSDTESKQKIFCKIMNIDLPNSQEIKTSIPTQSKILDIDSVSDSESEKESGEGPTILFKKKKKTKEATIDLFGKFDPDALPSRISTRIKKPPNRFGNCPKDDNLTILKSTFIPNLEEDIPSDIVAENILRLKSDRAKKSFDTSKLNVSNDTKKKHTKAKEKDTNMNPETKVQEEIPKKRETRSLKVTRTEETTTSKDSKTRKQSKFKEGKAEDTSKAENKKVPAKKGRPRKVKAEEKQEASVKQESKTLETRNNKSNDTRKGILKRRSSYSDTSNPELVRRSLRGRHMKDIDESEVYSSSNDTPRTKRGATNAVESPAKKYRPTTALGTVTNFRSTPSRRQKTHYVLFTFFPFVEVKHQLESLGAVVVNDVKECTVVLTQELRRTYKLLCAVGLGKPIVGWQWVQACIDNNLIVEPWLYLIQDEATEKKFNFKLERSLRSKRSFLKGFYVSSTPNVLPKADEMKSIVECSGGKWKELSSDAPKSNWLVVSSPADKGLWSAIQKRGGIIVSNDLILGGVLSQTLNIKQKQLA